MLKSDPRNSIGERELKELEEAIEDLRHRFEVYFAGIENINPSDKRIRIRGMISRLNAMHIKNASIRFRYQSTIGRFVTLNNYWERIIRQIENGTYKRDIFHANLKKGEEKKSFYSKDPQTSEAPNEAQAAEAAPETTPTSAVSSMNTSSPSGPSVSAVSSVSAVAAENQPSSPGIVPLGRQPQAASSNAGPAYDPIDQTIMSYLDKKRSLGDVTAGINRTKLRGKLESQREALKQKYNARDVEFRVEENNGKVILKPILKK